MAELLGAVTGATKIFFEVTPGCNVYMTVIQVNQVSVDNWTFKLYYKGTTTILLACSILSMAKQFFGDPINCDVVSWGTITRMPSPARRRRGRRRAQCLLLDVLNLQNTSRLQGGLSPETSCNGSQGHCSKRDHYGEELYNTYYQWVSIWLVLQVCRATQLRSVDSRLNLSTGPDGVYPPSDLVVAGRWPHEVPGRKCDLDLHKPHHQRCVMLVAR